MLKKAIRSLTPPLLWDGVKTFWASLRPPIRSWEDAVAAAGTYEDAELSRFRAERHALYTRSSNFPPPVEQSPLFWIASEISRPVTVVDFGGAFGEYGVSFLTRFPSCHYTVVETPSVVSGAPEGPVNFSTALPHSFDIFHASGVLQFLPNPYEVLAEAFSRAAVAVVLARTFFAEEDIFLVQESMLFENGAGDIPEGFKNTIVTYPARTLQIRRVIDLAAEAEFSLQYFRPEASDINVNGISTRLFVFMRNQ